MDWLPTLTQSLLTRIRNTPNFAVTLAGYTGCRPEQILVGNGCTELISLFIQINHPKKALIVSPTYSEYEREVRLNGGEVLYYALKEETEFQLDVEDFCNALAAEQADLCVICNPNNPTSTASSPEEMRRILARCQELGIFVMIDETYAEFAPDNESISSVGLLEG